MTTFKNEIYIDAAVEKVWDTLADFGGIQVFNPGVTESKSLGNKRSGMGAERQCNLGGPDTYILERIVDWQAGSQFTLEIYDGKKTPPFKKALSTFAVSPQGEGSKVTMDIAYQLKGGPLGWLMDRLLVSRKLGPSLAGVLAGLKRHVETGEAISESTAIDLTAVTAR